MKILIVDDYNFELYEVTEAKDGREGLELMSAFKPDLIISDALMPDMQPHLPFHTPEEGKGYAG